ncbi:MAG: esterase/lipase family protein, partial [Pseudomonadales bacterium]
MNPFATSKLLMSTIQASAQTIARQMRREQSESVRENYPIVLMHGLAGFREISIAGIKLFDYFNGVELMLNQMGYAAFAPQVAFFAKPQDRASAWFHEIEKIRRDTGAEKVHLVGHSQGGLDARVLVAPNKPAQDTPLGPLMGLGYGHHVASVVTFGTPHLGSVMVDMFNEGDPKNAKILNAVADLISVIARVFSGDPQDANGAIQALGRTYILDYFNPIIEDNPDVPCYTVAGDPETAELTSPLFTSSYKELLEIPVAEGGGPNDGLVTLQSGLFGCPLPGTAMVFDFCAKEHPRPHWQPLGVIQADHVEMTGIPAQLGATDV